MCLKSAKNGENRQISSRKISLKCKDMSAMFLKGSWDQIWTLRALQVPLGPSKGPLGAKTGPGVS